MEATSGIPIFPDRPGEARDPVGPAARRRAHRAATPLAEGRRFGGLPGMPGVLVGGLRAALMLPVRPGGIPSSALWCLLLVAMIFAVAIVGDALVLNDNASRFNWHALHETGLDLAFTVLASVWLTEAARDRGVATATAATNPPAPARGAAASVAPSAAAPIPVAPTFASPATEAPATGPTATMTAANPAMGYSAMGNPGPPNRTSDAAADGTASVTAARDPVPALHFATVMFSATFWIVVFGYAITVFLDRRVAAGQEVPIPGFWFYTLVVIWPWWVAVRCIQYLNRYRPIPIARRVIVLIALLALIGWALADPGEPYWIAPEPAEAETYAASEEILELQPRLLAERLEAVAAGRPGVVDLYFVSFAPYAGEDVFRRELDVIQPLMDQRFDTAGRSLRLVNSERTLREYPLATVSNLRRVLAALAAQMNRDEDVLFLYLTTHGSPRFDLATRLEPLSLYTLDPPTLARMLDDAGIRHRVIVVSACYSGGFVDALANPDTLIMTAARRDRTSFGCGNRSDFTWFGRALFDEALRRSLSFEGAFAVALPVIAEREKAAGFEPSEPQIAAGERIRARLGEFERRLAETASPRS
ncbi:MAG: C13 family peptidase [Burkholderiaceae bacterium]